MMPNHRQSSISYINKPKYNSNSNKNSPRCTFAKNLDLQNLTQIHFIPYTAAAPLTISMISLVMAA